MLFKRGSTISAAEGGCQAEVGGTSSAVTMAIFAHGNGYALVACSMASAGFAACMGGMRSELWPPVCFVCSFGTAASPETILQAAEIGIGENPSLRRST